jgi:hypothetical protein
MPQIQTAIGALARPDLHKLFHYLYKAEKFVYPSLPKIPFLSSGLTRDAAFPVCLVLWLLVRIQGMRASYFANLRPNSSTGKLLTPFPFQVTDRAMAQIRSYRRVVKSQPHHPTIPCHEPSRRHFRHTLPLLPPTTSQPG